MKVFDKYSNEFIGEVILEDRASLDQKIKTAKELFQTFRLSSVSERSSYIQNIIDFLKENQELLANLISKEAGKPLFYAKAEVDRCIRTSKLGLNYFEILEKHPIEVDLSGTSFMESYTQRFPVGVIFGISPFNFPINLALHKIIPAIASGCPILIKPSPYTPLSLNFLINELNKSFPKGLLTVVNCSNEDAEYMVKLEDISMVSFTGSDKVGWHIKSLVPNKKVALELGGNAAVYVDSSANLKGLALNIAKATTLYAGQICISTQRIFVHQEIYNEFKAQLIEAFQGITSGNPMDNVYNGPLIDEVHLARLQDWLDEAKLNGSQILTGGEAVSTTPPILAPTLIEGGKTDSKIFQEEAFGPVGVLHKVADFKEAILAINNSKYGLQAGIFAQDKGIIDEMFNNIDAGGVIINGVPGFRKDEMPYGGIKNSGFGREGIRYAMEEMTEIKLGIR